jgi:hypothetical protein
MLSHVAILVTMRGRYPPCDETFKWQSKDIRPTDEAFAARIGTHILAVTLMAARLAKERRPTAEGLLFVYSTYWPDILSNHHEQGMNRSISLSVNSYPTKQNPQAPLLLNFSLLFTGGTMKATLRWWAPALHLSMVHSPSPLYPRRDYWLRMIGKTVTLQSPLYFPLSSRLCDSMAGWRMRSPSTLLHSCPQCWLRPTPWIASRSIIGLHRIISTHPKRSLGIRALVFRIVLYHYLHHQLTSTLFPQHTILFPGTHLPHRSFTNESPTALSTSPRAPVDRVTPTQNTT